jgi:hypothetical protein
MRPKQYLVPLRPGQQTIGAWLTDLARQNGDPRVTPPVQPEPRAEGALRAGADFSSIKGLGLPWGR